VAEFATFLLAGLATGALYALLAMPMVLIWSTTDVLDLNVGGYAVISGMVAATVGGVSGILLGIGAAVIAGLVTALVFLAFHRLWDIREHMRIVLATFGLLFIVQAVLQAKIGTDNLYLDAIGGQLRFGGANVTAQGVINMCIALALLAVLTGVLKFTSAGLKMRAAAQSPIPALLAGIEVRRTQFVAFLIGAAMAGVVGILAATSTGVSYSRGVQLTTFAFSAVIIFGVQGTSRAFLGGIALGVAQALGAGYLPNGWSELVSPVVIVLVLTFGSLQSESVDRVRA
jgi:branched-subunit amino acid ABC-type transport system permease component